MGVLRPLEVGARRLVVRTRWLGSRLAAYIANPPAVAFCDALAAEGYEVDDLVNVAPALGVIYVSVPKAASTRIKRTLAEAVGRHSPALGGKRRLRGVHGPRSMTVGAFHRLATDPRTLRFSFVRNPYARAVSCRADKWQDRPLAAGDPFIDRYLALRPGIDAALPSGADRTLSFADFVTFAGAIAEGRIDSHLQAQHDIVAMPGIRLDFVGRIERFADDFATVLDHVGAKNGIRDASVTPVNPSRHGPWENYYTLALRKRVYRAYERDFDRFQYPRGF
jgi:hypothetical protein